MSNFNWTQGLVVLVIGLILGGILGVMIFQKEIEAECPDGNQTQADCPVCDGNQTQADCPVCEKCLTEEDKLIISGYLVEGITLQKEFNWDKYRRLNLFDGDVEFEGDDYDAKEVFGLTGLKLLANGDFEGVPYLTVPDSTIFYRFEIPYLNKDDIKDGETLTFNLLGKDVEISEWVDDEVTFTQGDSYTLSEGNSTIVEGKVVTLTYALEKSALIDVDGKEKEVNEGDTKIWSNGLQVKVEYSFETTGFRTGEARLVIGKEVERVVGDRDLYAKDSIWEWEITDKYIGLILVEDFTDDEDALEFGEFVCLPNNYLCVIYNGIVDETTEEYTFEKRDSYIEAEGNFISSEDVDYDKVYIDSTGIYSDDERIEGVFNISNCINETTIKLGDTNSVLVLEDSSNEDELFDLIVINDFKVNLNLSNVFGNKESLIGEEHDYLTDYGILIEDPKDSIGDEFTVMVPEEKLEGSLVIKQGKPEETEEDTEEEKEE